MALTEAMQRENDTEDYKENMETVEVARTIAGSLGS
jgi:hypothetical protein